MYLIDFEGGEQQVSCFDDEENQLTSEECMTIAENEPSIVFHYPVYRTSQVHVTNNTVWIQSAEPELNKTMTAMDDLLEYVPPVSISFGTGE